MRTRKGDVLTLSLVLVIASHAVPYWLITSVFSRAGLYVYQTFGVHAYANLFDAGSLLLPLLLCIGSPRRYGLRLGDWSTHRLKLLGVTVGPVIAVVVGSRFTSQPFAGGRIGSWLISPAAQDLLFAGYLYVLLAAAFPGPAVLRVAVNRAVLIGAVFFMLWHIPNFIGMSAAFVSFQLFYTFLFGLCFLSAREWTGSIIPGLLSHMACNLLSWIHW